MFNIDHRKVRIVILGYDAPEGFDSWVVQARLALRGVNFSTRRYNGKRRFGDNDIPDRDQCRT